MKEVTVHLGGHFFGSAHRRKVRILWSATLSKTTFPFDVQQEQSALSLVQWHQPVGSRLDSLLKPQEANCSWVRKRWGRESWLTCRDHFLVRQLFYWEEHGDWLVQTTWPTTTCSPGPPSQSTNSPGMVQSPPLSTWCTTLLLKEPLLFLMKQFFTSEILFSNDRKIYMNDIQWHYLHTICLNIYKLYSMSQETFS